MCCLIKIIRDEFKEFSSTKRCVYTILPPRCSSYYIQIRSSTANLQLLLSLNLYAIFFFFSFKYRTYLSSTLNTSAAPAALTPKPYNLLNRNLPIYFAKREVHKRVGALFCQLTITYRKKAPFAAACILQSTAQYFLVFGTSSVRKKK